MDIMRYKEYEGTAEIDMDRCICRGKILFIDDLVVYEASSPADLKHAFEAAVDDYIETCEELGKEPQKPLKGVFNVRVKPELHRDCVLRAKIDGVTLNEVVVRAISAYVSTTSSIQNNYHVTLVSTEKKEFETGFAVGSQEDFPMLTRFAHAN